MELVFLFLFAGRFKDYLWSHSWYMRYRMELRLAQQPVLNTSIYSRRHSWYEDSVLTKLN